MKKLILALTLLSSPALAVNTEAVGDVLRITQQASTNKYNLIEGLATNGSPAVIIPLGAKYSKLRVATFVTFAANTYVTIKFECSIDGKTTGLAINQTRAIAAGVATLSDLSDKKTLGGASKSPMTEYDVGGCESVRLTLGGDNTDVASLQAVAVK
jgi:hypothetical protein